MYRHHRDQLKVSSEQSTIDHTRDLENYNFSEDDIGGEMDSDSNTVTAPTTNLPSPGILGAQYILKIRDGKNLTQVTTNSIIEDTVHMLQSYFERIKKNVLDKMSSETVLSQEQMHILESAIDEAAVNPFSGLETEYKQEKFMRENFNYVVRHFFSFLSLPLCITSILGRLMFEIFLGSSVLLVLLALSPCRPSFIWLGLSGNQPKVFLEGEGHCDAHSVTPRPIKSVL